MRMRRLKAWPDLANAPEDEWYDWITVPDDTDSLETRRALGWETVDEVSQVIVRHPDSSVGLVFVPENTVDELLDEGYFLVDADEVVFHEGRLAMRADVEPVAEGAVEEEPVGDGYWLIHDQVIEQAMDPTVPR